LSIGSSTVATRLAIYGMTSPAFKGRAKLNRRYAAEVVASIFKDH